MVIDTDHCHFVVTDSDMALSRSSWDFTMASGGSTGYSHEDAPLHPHTWELVLSVVCIPSDTPLEKSKFFLCKSMSNGDSFLVWCRRSYPLFPLSARTPSGLHLCRSCAYCLSLCEFICVSALLYLEGPVYFVSSISTVF